MFDSFQQSQVCRQPLHRVQRLPGKPSRILVLIQMQRLRLQPADKAMHPQMKSRVVPLHSLQQLPDRNLRIQFLLNFPPESLLRTLSRLNLPAGKLPPTLPLAIPALGGEDLLVLDYYGGDDLDCFHCRAFNP